MPTSAKAAAEDYEEGDADSRPARGRLLKLGDHTNAINLDLIEWLSPRTEGRAYPRLNHAGITRITLLTGNLQKTYEELKAKGIEFYSEPQVQQSAGGAAFSPVSRIPTARSWS